MWYQIQGKEENIQVGVVYRPPGISHEEDDKLWETLRQIANHKRMMVVGDFNLPDIKWDILDAVTRRSREFIKLVQDNYWYQHISEPTRGENILDLLLTSEKKWWTIWKLENK